MSDFWNLEAAGKDDNAEAEGRSNGSTAFAMSGGHANNAVDGRGMLYLTSTSTWFLFSSPANNKTCYDQDGEIICRAGREEEKKKQIVKIERSSID